MPAGTGPGGISSEGGKVCFDCAPPSPLPPTHILITSPLLRAPELSYRWSACHSHPLLCGLLEEPRQECSPFPPPPSPTLSTLPPTFARFSPSFKTDLSCFPFSQSPPFSSVMHQAWIDVLSPIFALCWDSNAVRIEVAGRSVIVTIACPPMVSVLCTFDI